MEADNSGCHDNENGKNGEKYYCNKTEFLEDIVEGEQEEEEEEDDDIKLLKSRISSHPLYGQLIETHLNCLKVGLGEAAGGVGRATDMVYDLNQAKLNLKPNIPTCDELDHFMKAYCLTLKQLKEAMEEPVKKTTTFIDEMYIQLRELSERERETNPKSNSKNH